MTDKTLVGYKCIQDCENFTEGKIYFFTYGGDVINDNKDVSTIVDKLSMWFQPVYADSDGWIDHGGGPCPVDEGMPVEVMFRTGGIDTVDNPYFYAWDRLNTGGDIIAFRLHKEERAATPDNIVDTQTLLDPTIPPGECVEELHDITCSDDEQPQFLRLIRKGIYTGKSAPSLTTVIEGTHVTDFREESPQERAFRLKQEAKQQPAPEPRKCFPASAMGDSNSHAMLLGVNQFVKGEKQ